MGEPSEHSTAAYLYGDMLAEDLKRIDADRKLEDAEQMDRLFAKWNEGSAPDAKAPNVPAHKGLFGRLFGR